MGKTTSYSRRCWLKAFVFLHLTPHALAQTTQTAQATQTSFPARPITLICPFPPGASADALLRALGRSASRQLGQPVIVENRPGAAGTLGPSVMATAPPDGYTLAMVTNTLVRQPFIVPTTRYDPIKDFVYIIGVSSFDFGLVVDAKASYETFDGFVAYARARRGQVTYGTIGVGSVPHQVMSAVADKLGIDWTHVPYKGSAQIQIDLQGGSVHAMADATGWAPLVDTGRLRLLAVFGDRRMKRYPNVPTLKDLGLDIADSAPSGLAGPKDMEPRVVKTLHDAFLRAMSDPDFEQALEATASEVLYRSSEDYQRYMRERVPLEKLAVERFGLRDR